MLKKCAIGLIFSAALPAAYAGAEVGLSCDQSPRDFFAPLVQQRLIDTKPHLIGRGSVNFFKPKFFARMTVYGLPVVDVFGYSDDPLLFIQRGDGHEVYGVIVQESIANVQAQLTSVGATQARTFRIDAKRTAIACKGEI